MVCIKNVKKTVSVAVLAVFLILIFPVLCFADNDNETYLLLGDSIAAGTGTLNPSVQCYGWIVSEEKDYIMNNLAVNGYTSSDLLGYLENTEVISAVRSAKVVSISVGGNDFLHSQPYVLLAKAKLTGDYSKVETLVDLFEVNYRGIIDKILEYNPDVLIVLQTLYNPFYNEYRNPCEKALEIFNERVNKVAAEYGTNIIVADVKTSFDDHPEYIADDTIHPNETGHKEIARVVGECITGYYDGGMEIDVVAIRNDPSTVIKLVVSTTALFAAFAFFIYYRKK